MARTAVNVLISTIRPNKKGNRGPRTARTTKKAKNKDHGHLLQQCEKAQSERETTWGRTRMIFASAWKSLDSRNETGIYGRQA